jgi:uncharacterized membrane protein
VNIHTDPKSSRSFSGALTAPGVTLRAGVLLLVCFLFIAACTRQPVYPEPERVGTDVSLDVRGLQDGVPEFYTLHHMDRAITFFVVKIDGRVLSFLDACMKCHPKKLGFRFDDGSVSCRACDESYPVSDIERGFGSCYPIKLQGRTDGEKYYISVSVLEEMAKKYFS